MYVMTLFGEIFNVMTSYLMISCGEVKQIDLILRHYIL